MQRLQAYRFELQPNGEQQHLMRRFAGPCRFVYNKALDGQQERNKAGKKTLGYAALCQALTEWKAQPQRLWLNGNTKPSPAAVAQESGTGLQELLRETSGLPALQEKRSVR